MIGLLILIVIAILLFNSFSKFNSWNRRFEGLLEQINQKLSTNSDDVELIYSKAECLMNLQNYYKASIEFQKVLTYYDKSNFSKKNDAAQKNIQFCNKPLMISGNGPKDYSGSYLHFILLKQLGNTRVITLGI